MLSALYTPWAATIANGTSTPGTGAVVGSFSAGRRRTAAPSKVAAPVACHLLHPPLYLNRGWDQGNGGELRLFPPLERDEPARTRQPTERRQLEDFTEATVVRAQCHGIAIMIRLGLALRLLDHSTAAAMPSPSPSRSRRHRHRRHLQLRQWRWRRLDAL